MKKVKKKNPEMLKLVEDLSNREGIWKEVAKRLLKPRRNVAEVNVEKINRFANDGDTILVPGKVLGYGNINKKVDIAAFKFSKEAKNKIKNSGGKCMSIEELVNSNPKGNKIRIFG